MATRDIGSIGRTLAGQAELSIGGVLREAWERTHGIKRIVVGGALLVYAAVWAASWILGTIFGFEEQTLVGATITQLVLMMLVYPFMAGVFMIGLHHSVGARVRFQDQFGYYAGLLPIVAVGLLQSAATGLGLMLCVLPGIYLMIAFTLAIPLKTERGLGAMDCLVTSLRLVNRKFFEVTVLLLAAGVLLAVGLLSVIGWIWTMPWVLMIYAIVYRQLAGCAAGAQTAPREMAF